MKTFRVFHFCGCVTRYARPWQGLPRLAAKADGWRLVGFEQRCDRRWRAGHFGLTRDQEAEAEGESEYSIQLFDRYGEAFAGASVPAAGDDAANDEAREFALEHEKAVRARVRCKADGRTWFVEVR